MNVQSNQSLKSLAGSRRAVAIPLHDVNALAEVPRRIYVGTGGTIVMRGVDDQADTTWVGVPAGTVLPFRPAFIRATGTTAANILGLY
ncbi:MAG: hypothetical protein M3Q08_00990 [Pseudomonadota bacterium]|nr:hypothetical protein [Pseudomonadota bacterium]